MSTSTTTKATVRDGTELLVRHWSARGEPWASVMIVHGIAEHSGRYEHVGGWLAAAGLDVHAYDQRGFGGSSGRRAWLDRWSRALDDLEDRLAVVRVMARGRPLVVYGHSLGGLISLGYAVADPPRPLPDALVLSAPAIDSTIPGWKRALVRVLGAIAPRIAIPNGVDGTLLSRDPTVGERYLEDKRNEHATTARFGAEGLAEQARVRAALGRLLLPTLVIHGEADRLVPTTTSATLGSLPGVTRRTYSDLRHEVHNEPEGPEVIADVIAWLHSTVGSSAGDGTAPGSGARSGGARLAGN